MKKLFVLVAVLVLVMAVSCDTLNIGTTARPDKGPVIGTSTFVPATTWNGAEMATLTINWGVTGSAPYTIVVDMGGGVVEAPNNGAVTNPFTQTFTLVAGGPFTWTATVTDANGNFGTATGTYTVDPALNAAPVIENVAVAGGVVTVTVSDLEGDDVTVTATAFAGATVSAAVVVAGGNGDAVFTFTADSLVDGATGTTDITAADANGSDTDSTPVTIPGVSYTAPAGAIGAAPLQTTAAVGATVTILVIAGDFPAAAAFNYMNGCAITTPDGGDFVDDTFNVGSLGGAQKDADGIWGDMAPAPNTFFLPENFMMKAADVAADGTLDYMGFNITPIGAGEVTGGGDLFNFGMAFDAAGTYQLGFLEFQDVKRTYYSDNAAVEYNWADITNVIDGVPNTITVN